MLGKLLKYDLKFVYRSVWIFYTLVLGLSTLARILFEAEQTTLVMILHEIFMGAAISIMCSGVINNMFGCWRRFCSHLYGDESYLTHTLPVEKGTIYTSHFLNAIITMFTSVLVALAGLLIMFYSKENLEMLRTALKGMAEHYESTPMAIVLLVAVLIFAQMTFIVQVGYTGVVLGHRSEERKMGKGVLLGFVLYFAAQVCVLGVVYIIALFQPDVMRIFTDNTMVSVNALKFILYVVGALYVLFIFLSYLVDIRLLQKGVNVE